MPGALRKGAGPRTDAGHISDDDLERYVLRMVTEEAELQRIEGHLLACAPCAERVRQARKYILAMKAALGRFLRPGI